MNYNSLILSILSYDIHTNSIISWNIYYGINRDYL